jgi:virginiamycin B lyase
MWFGGGQFNNIGRIDPWTDEITMFPMPSGQNLNLPKNSIGDIVAGPDGNMWFTYIIRDKRTANAGKIGRITPQGTVSLYPIPIEHFEPFAITVGPDKNIWFIGTGHAAPGRPYIVKLDMNCQGEILPEPGKCEPVIPPPPDSSSNSQSSDVSSR